jgi:hypothetical protein
MPSGKDNLATALAQPAGDTPKRTFFISGEVS